MTQTDNQGGGEVTPAASPEVTDDVIEEHSITVTDIGQPSLTEEYAAKRAWWQEIVRAQLAVLFTLIFIGTVVFACLRVSGSDWANTKELLQILLPAEMALIGSATGFYYGSRRNGD